MGKRGGEIGLVEQAIEKWRFSCFLRIAISEIHEFLRKRASFDPMNAAGL
jgi:hypothetical protein